MPTLFRTTARSAGTPARVRSSAGPRTRPSAGCCRRPDREGTPRHPCLPAPGPENAPRASAGSPAEAPTPPLRWQAAAPGWTTPAAPHPLPVRPAGIRSYRAAPCTPGPGTARLRPIGAGSGPTRQDRSHSGPSAGPPIRPPGISPLESRREGTERDAPSAPRNSRRPRTGPPEGVARETERFATWTSGAYPAFDVTRAVPSRRSPFSTQATGRVRRETSAHASGGLATSWEARAATLPARCHRTSTKPTTPVDIAPRAAPASRAGPTVSR